MSTLNLAPSHTHPAVTGKPLLWLRAEGLIEVAATLLLFHATHQSWWLLPVILVPDLAMTGYLRGTTIGAALYNTAHSHIPPILLALAALRWHHQLLLALALLWLTHIGLDRAFAYGLKYDTNFQHTHLGNPTANGTPQTQEHRT